jgi:heptosyltransferase-2
VQLLFLKTIGWLVAHAPESLLQGFSAALGDFIFFALRRRRRLVLSNLHHAFPGKPAAWHRAIGRESCRRLIETGLLSLATPFLDAERYRRIIRAAPGLVTCYAEHHAEPQATLICSPHLAYWEAQTAMSLVVSTPFPEFGTIFRPLDNAAANHLVKSSRERFGMKLLSRKDGFAEALKILRRRGYVGILFDQNAGMQGALTTLFDRVCSTTELPGLLAEKFDARVYGIFPRRLGFWRVEIDVERIPTDGTSAAVTFALNRWLEERLSADDNLCASWLWVHDRWRHQDMPAARLRLESRRNLLTAELQSRGLASLPRRTRLWIRLPNWLGDVVMAVPLLRAIRASRPDAEITVLARPQFVALLETWGVADRVRPLPPLGRGYFSHFWRLRDEFPDTWLLFTNSFRGDLEAWLVGAPQRFGLVRPGKLRPLLSHAFRVPAAFDEREHHQLELWDNFLRHFGLNAPADRAPRHVLTFNRQPEARIALIAGSENNPEKRWPVEHWRALIRALPGERFTLLGTANDLPITTAIADGFDPDHVRNFAGRTNLALFESMLFVSRLLVTNDTGGMHLANAVGVPLVALFGPTNPVRTGPVFEAPAIVLQPPGCPPTGGGALADLQPETVAAAVRERLRAPASQVDRLPT